MTKEELALKLEGSEYREGFPEDIMKIAKENKLVVFHGYSDDIPTCDGFICDEVPFDVYLDEDGIIENKCDDYDCPYYLKLVKKAKKVQAEFDSPRAPWSFTTDLPYAEFNIYEDGDLWCIALIIDLKDIQ